MNKPKLLFAEKRICIICEGHEEYSYLERIKELKRWNKKYCVDLIDAKGNGSISAIYQDKFQNGSYDAVLIFCDTDKKPFKQYNEIKEKIDDFHGVIKGEVSDLITIFGNPCTMQIIIMHWDDIKLKSNSKNINAPDIERCTGIKNYDAHNKQCKTMMKLIDDKNYDDMISRISNLPNDYKELSSSNFNVFMEYLGNEDTGWIDNINAAIFKE